MKLRGFWGTAAAALAVTASQVSCGSSQEQANLDVHVSGQGAVISSPGPIFCPRDERMTTGICSATFTRADEPVRLEASPAPGWAFVKWNVSSTPAMHNPTGTRTQNPIRVVFEGNVDQTWTAVFVRGDPVPPPQDAGQPPTDAGVEPDAGHAADSGTEVDAGVEPDAGMEPDAGVDRDAGVEIDAGVEFDAGIDLDAGIDG